MKTWCPDCEEPRFHRPEGKMELCELHKAERLERIRRSNLAIEELNKPRPFTPELTKLLEELNEE